MALQKINWTQIDTENVPTGQTINLGSSTTPINEIYGTTLHINTLEVSGLTTSWDDVTEKPSWLSGTTLENFQTGHTHSQYTLQTDFNTFSGTTLPNNYYNKTQVNSIVSGATSGFTRSWLSGTTLEDFQTGHTHSYNNLNDVPTNYINTDGSNSNIELITFDVTYTGNTFSAGKMGWDANHDTLTFGLPDGGSIQVGKENFDYYRNLESVNIVAGDILSYCVTPGNAKGCKLTDVTNKNLSYSVIGMSTSDTPVPPGEYVRVTKLGEVHNLDTRYDYDGNDLFEGVPIFVHPTQPGKWTSIQPSSPNYTVVIGAVNVKNQNVGVIGVKIITIPKIGDLSDFNGTTPSQFHTIMYDGTQWDSSPYYYNNHNYTDGSFRIYGGEIIDNGDGTVKITAGRGMVHTLDGVIEGAATGSTSHWISPMVEVTWDEIPSYTGLTNNAYNFLYYDYETQTIKSTIDFYTISFHREFTIGRVYKTNNQIVARLCGTNAWAFDKRAQLFGEEVFPVVRAKGMIIGAGSTERTITITAGVLWAELVNRFSVNAFDSSGSGSFSYWYRNSPSGWITVTGQTQIDNIYWDDNTGTLNDLTTNRYGVHWVYEVHDSSVHVVYGQGDYTLALAQTATPPSSLPGLIAAYATLIGKIIIQKSSPTFYSIQNPFTTTFQASATTDHTDLSNLVWGSSKHTGTASTLAAFDGSGNPTYVTNEFDSKSDKNNTFTTQTGTTYTIQESDNSKIIKLSNTSTVTITLPTGLTEGFECAIIKTGTGDNPITFTGGTNTTLLSADNYLSFIKQYGVVSVIYEGSGNWYIIGTTS